MPSSCSSVARTIVDLDHAVLQAGGDAELLLLGRADDVRQLRLRDRDAVERHERAIGGRDDRGGARHADEARDRGLGADREVAAVERDAVLLGVGVERLDRGLEQAHAAVVAEEAHVLDEGVERIVAQAVAARRQDREVRRLPERHLGPEVREGEGDGLAEVAVGRVADQGGAGGGGRADDHRLKG